MTIDIRAFLPPLAKGPDPPPMTLEDEAHYWFLWPLIDALRASHGKYVDLYGDVDFRSSEIPLLEKLIADARESLSSQPEEWQQSCGTTQGPGRSREVLKVVRRVDVVEWLDRLSALAATAREGGGTIQFFGD